MLFIPVGAASHKQQRSLPEKPLTKEEKEKLAQQDGCAQGVSFIIVLPFAIWAVCRLVGVL